MIQSLRLFRVSRFFLLFFAAAIPAAGRAAVVTWDGGGADGKWSSAENWVGDVAPAASGDTIIFAGTTNLSVTNDRVTSLGTAAAALTFTNNAGSFVLSGGAMTAGTTSGNVVLINNLSTNNQLISNAINMAGGQRDVNIAYGAGAGMVTLAGSINFNTCIMGLGFGSSASTSPGTLVLSGSNTGLGKANQIVGGGNSFRAVNWTSPDNNRIILGSDTALGSTNTGSVTAGTAVLNGLLTSRILYVSATNGDRNLAGNTFGITGGRLEFDGANNLTIGHVINSGGNRDLWVTGAGKLTVAGSIFLSQDATGRSLYLNITGSGGAEVNGPVYDTLQNTSGTFATVAAPGQLRKAGGGLLRLNGNTAHLATNSVEAGTLLVNGTHAPGANSGRYTVASSATVGGNGTIRPFDTTGSLTGLSVSGTLSPGDPSVNGGIGTLTLDGANSTRSLLALETGAKMQVNLMTDTNSSRLSDTVAILGANGTANEVFFNGTVFNFSDPTGILPAGDYVVFTANAANAFSSGTISVGSGLDAYTTKSLNRTGNNIVLTLGPATVPTNSPPVPVGLAATAPLPYRVLLNWNHSYRATSYVVRRGTASGAWTNLATVTAPATSYADTNATPGLIYYYVVSAVNAAGTSANSTEVAGAAYEPRGIGINLKPASVAGMSTNHLAGVVRLPRWNNLTGPTGTGSVQSLTNPVDSSGAVAGGMSITVTGGSGGSTFAYNSATGNDGTLFDAVFDQFNGTAGTISVTGVPYATYDVYLYMRDDGAARGGMFTIGGTTYYVRGGAGNPTTNGTGYVLSTATADAGAATTQGNYVRFSGLTNTNFTCSFVAFNAGDSVQRLKFPGFQIVSGAPVNTVPPSVPTGLTIKATGLTSVLLDWQAAAGATDYLIYRSTTAGVFDYGSPLASVPAASDSFTDSTAVAGTTYYYVVRASNGAGSSASSTQVSSPAPELSSFAVASPVLWPGQGTTLSWNVPNATSVSLDSGGSPQSVPADHSLAVTPSGTTVYTLSASNAHGSSSRQLTVSIVPKPATRDALWQWSVPITGFVSGETQDNPRAFLYIPPGCKRVRGVLIGQHNMLEEPIMEHAAVRQGLADAGMAAIWVTPAFNGNFNFTASPDAPVLFQQMMDALAAESGYAELSKAPVVWIGHSAMAEAPYFFAAWDAQNSVATGVPRRCAAAISVKGWYPGKHDATTPTYVNSDLAGVPLMYVEGEYADANGRAGGTLTFRNATAGSIVSYFADVGGGHFDWNDNICEYLGMYLRKIGQHRLPDTAAADGTAILKTINPAIQGWMADRWRKGQSPTATPAAVGAYTGNTNEAFWYFDEEHAQETYTRQLPVKTQYQLLGYTQDGVLVPQQETHIQVQAPFVPDPGGDGLTFKLGTTFLTNVPAVSSRLAGWSGLPVGSAISHSTNGPIVMHRICGPVEQLSPDTFRIAFDRVGTENRYGQNRSRDICFMAVHPGDTNYVRAVQQGMVRIPLPLTSGTAQSISFPSIPDQSINTSSIPLVASTTGTNTYPGAKVSFYVREGPAKVNGDTLEFTAPPPRTKFPVKVTVVANQYGRTIAPLLQTATPVTNTFNITATEVEQWRLRNFGTPLEEEEAADSADPDGDGRNNALEREMNSDPNSANLGNLERYQTWARDTNVQTPGSLVKYAFGGAADIHSVGELPTLSSDGVELVMTAVVRTNNPGLLVIGVMTTNLAAAWSPLTNNPHGVPSTSLAGVPAGCQRRDFRLPITAEHQQAFLRLQSTFVE